MCDSKDLNRRGFLGNAAAAVGGAALAAGTSAAEAGAPAGPPTPADSAARHAQLGPNGMPYGILGKARVSRLMLGGNLVSGVMHCRDLHYVQQLFRAYVTEEKLMQTFKVAEENGINTVFETGANWSTATTRSSAAACSASPTSSPTWAAATPS